MIFPDFSEFCELAKQGNFVPVYQEWVADLDTPVSAWYKVCAGQTYSFLLESVEGGEKLGRYSWVGCDPLWILEATGENQENKTDGYQTIQTFRDGKRIIFEGDPFNALTECLTALQPVNLPQLPPGINGLFGFWGYELIRWIEPRVKVHPQDERNIPDGLWMQVDHLLIFDQMKRKIWAVAYADLRSPNVDLKAAYSLASGMVSGMVNKLSEPLPPEKTIMEWTPPGIRNVNVAEEYKSNFTKAEFCASVVKAKEYIKAGDIFQVVVSQRLSTAYNGEPFALYRSLRQINPSPYMCYFHFKDWQIIGSSPEVMVKAQSDGDGIVATVRPIAGTRPRGKTVREDAEFAEDLLKDPKEIAEHVMLVDLGRNDLGRVCINGSVTVDDLMKIERYSHVMHIVSNVVGKLAPGKNAWDLLKACFPAGTVSGAPKIRAMEIIHELEPSRRGVYSGVYGYYDFEGQLNSAIAIRTMVVRDNTVMVQAGAGLVADSEPEKEYEETLNKARGLLEAIRCLKNY
ncbi:anthranilate synthase component I [Rivularia sp. UHCC 0363]|uniref:anthranilate synthase component I n=1 Tax=Rivularia sp. UHCC 0363 TaxID=3110244 RepID=UPI002B216E34|nr:anthranilate synthase component I [Rivularia sp. UHCC 0363]MEA5594813.1 anthranilate synthase component I [Rivularia sp. UHCC 0363]